jgi:hypothetical protein
MMESYEWQETDQDDDQDELTDDEDDDREEDEDDDPSSDDDEDQDEPFERGQKVLADADPDVVDAHRDLLAAVISHLDNEEEDLLRVAHRAGVETLNPDEMSHEDLARITYELSENYPETMDAVTNRFPHAESFLASVLSGKSISEYE